MSSAQPRSNDEEPEDASGDAVPWRPGRGLIAIFLWLTIVSAAMGIYNYWLGEGWTLLLVMLTSLFLGLLTFSLMAEHAHDSTRETPPDENDDLGTSGIRGEL